MPSLPRTSSVRTWLACVLLAICGADCGNESAKESQSEAAEPASPPAPEAAEAAEAARPLDPSYVPTETLGEFEDLALESFPPCSDTIDTLKPALESIASFRHKLGEAKTEADAVRLLTALSTELSSRLPSIASRSETDELRRISAELSASVGDLAESLKLASDAITTQDKQASAQVLRRIQNGVANTRSSIERLIDQCAS